VVWETPSGRGKRWLEWNRALAKLLEGWQLSVLHSAQTGFPFTVNLAGDTAGIGGGTGAILIRPNAAPGQHWRLPANERSTARWFNTGAFLMPPTASFGNVGRNTVIGPGLINLDLSASRSFRVGERVRLQFRSEFFNLFNTPNYNVVGRIINNPQFGAVQSQLPPRQIQFGARFAW
jgi:hypothetical protein